MGKRVVRHLKQVALLWVDLLGFARAHAESGGIKAPHVVNQASRKGIASADLIG